MPYIDYYEIAKDFSNPIITAIVAVTGLWYAVRKIDNQPQNTLTTQNDDSKRNTRIELFKEITEKLNHSSEVFNTINVTCHVKSVSSKDKKAEISHQEYDEFIGKFSPAIFTLISTIESHEIIHPILFKTFRYALQSTLHDFSKIQFESDRATVLERLIEYSSDAAMYSYDFQICMQNITYGEEFKSELPHRIAIDERCKVITNDPVDLKKLHDYFCEESNWGKNRLKYENEAKEMYSSEPEHQE